MDGWMDGWMQCANDYPVILTVKFAFSEGGCALPFQATDLWKSLGHTASFKDQKLSVWNPKNIQSTPDISVLEQNENKNWKQNKAKAPFLAHFQREENNIFLSITKQDRWEHTPCWSEQADVLEQTPARGLPSPGSPARVFTYLSYGCLGCNTKNITQMCFHSWENPTDLRNERLWVWVTMQEQ